MVEQKIVPNIWFTGNAREAIEFYISVFPDSSITGGSKYPTEGLLDFQKPLAGKDLTVEFQVGGLAFVGINAGPEFSPNPSISFMVNFDPSQDPQAREHLDEIWSKLSDGGEALMPLDTYPFSEHYGWIKDKYGLTWQLMLTNPKGEPRPYIIPCLMYVNPDMNKAEEVIDYYCKVFTEAGHESKIGTVAHYPAGQAASENSVMFADFNLAGQWFAAMDAGAEHDFAFNEAISLSISCKDQVEIDYFWDKLSSVPEAEQCGWCKDTFGVSWQIVPTDMDDLMQKSHAFEHMMQMKKLIIEEF